MNVVVDASVVVKWFIPERDHANALALRDDYLDGDVSLFAPALLPFEVINALRYSGHFEGDSLIASAESLSDYGIELHSFINSGPVAETANYLDVPVYDASYLALARTVDGRTYTADDQFMAATEKTRLGERISHINEYD